MTGNASFRSGMIDNSLMGGNAILDSNATKSVMWCYAYFLVSQQWLPLVGDSQETQTSSAKPDGGDRNFYTV
jgi:hypothetical protein